MRRLALAAVALLAFGGTAFAYVREAEPAWWIRLWYPLRYEQTVVGYARIYGLDPALVAAVVYEESRFRPETRSDAGAVGLMQLLPDTARGIAERTGGHGFRESDLLSPDINVRYGCWYLRHLRRKYAAHPAPDRLALAAYHAGQANVDRWIEAAPPGGRVRIAFAETRAYVDAVLHVRDLYRRAYGDRLRR